MKMSTLDWVASILVIVGALNWGLIGFFKYDLVTNIFGGGDMYATVARVVFALVGLSGLWMIMMMSKKS